MKYKSLCCQFLMCQADSSDHFTGVAGILCFVYLPSYNISVPEIGEEVQVIVKASDRTVQVSDIPHPDLIRACCHMGCRFPAVRPCSSSAVIVDLLLPHDAVKCGFRADICPFIGKIRNNLTWRHIRILGRIYGIKHLLAFFSRKLVLRIRMYCLWTAVTYSTRLLQKTFPPVIRAV